jgi:hypothetical protein
MGEQWIGWHWLRDDGKLNYPPRRKVEVGQTLRLPRGQAPSLCERGFHASKRALDALQYAPGALVCRVTLGGTISEGSDKACASERTVLWMADATNVLHEFACWCAEGALKAAKVQDARCWKAIETKRRWITREATDEELAAARDAAWAAAWAARAAASDAARDAAWAEQKQKFIEVFCGENAPQIDCLCMAPVSTSE